MADEKTRKLLGAKRYLGENKVHGLLEQLTMELVQYKPNQPLSYLIDRITAIKEGRGRELQDRPSVVFVLGGPGCGKGTQCAKIIDEFGCLHVGAGDLLRNEVKCGSEQGKMVAECIREGRVVPGEVTIGLLKKEIEKNGSGQAYLIDGFPRELTQAMMFEQDVTECSFVLNFEAPDDVLIHRLTHRGKTSGRTDDNPESIMKRLRTFHSQTRPVLEYFAALGKLRSIDATGSPEDVWKTVEPLFR
ncbi:Uridylate kinase [Diplonema papillatum]|nr:Uridylate kinase [Diplonema papillatum]|eukprot:gene4321-6687_t